MSLTAEQVAKRLEEAISYPRQVVVRVRTQWHNDICCPDTKGDEEEQAIFRTLSFGDNHIIERACQYEVDDGDGFPHFEVDVNEVRRMIVKRNLLSWTLDIPIEREAGWMTKESYERVGNIPAPLMDAFLDGFEDKTMVSKEEEEKIAKQSAVLFGKSGHGVTDACEAVSLFCTLGNFFEKFGINKEDMAELPYREYLLLKIMISHESNAMKRANNTSGSKPSPTRIIAGHGGKSRPSAGIKRAM